MSSTTGAPNPADLERRTNAARAQVDRTLDELQERLSLKRRMAAATGAVSAAANRVSERASPQITTLIRLDHGHVLAAFRRYHSRLSDLRKTAVVANVCLALQIHTQLEQEIFYPALLAQGGGVADLDKSVAEHDQARALIERLRQMRPRDAEYDQTFYQLMRTVLHHVADEETRLLPFAEYTLKPQLRELGWKMTVRRLALLKPHAAEAARTTALTFPVATGAMVAGFATAVWLLLRGRLRSHR
jgi:Hemerythrin HHE cation binding domain/Protein of unknown function (DUF3618)